jgi:hypothetical protein
VKQYRSGYVVCLVAGALAAFVMLANGWANEDDDGAVSERLRYLTQDQCYVCHLEEDYLPEGFNEDDIHLQNGLSCAGCHGGDPTSDDEAIAMSTEKGFVGAPDKSEMPDFCGKCHSGIEFMRQYQPRIATDQVQQYYTSVHGQLLKSGDDNVAGCADCHTSHAIFPARDARSTVFALNVPKTCNNCHGNSEYMSGYGIPTTQYDDFAQGVHGIALLEREDTGAPACNDCHGNHGATPPGVAALSQVCGECHVNNQRYFDASSMAEVFAEDELHACEECHGNHKINPTNDDMVGNGESSTCTECHSKGDAGYAASDTIRQHLAALGTVYDLAMARQEEVQLKGMDDMEIAYLLQESHQSLIQARTLVHTFDPVKVQPKTDEGRAKAETAIEIADATIKDYYVRRRGLLLATLFITLLVVALVFKIRQMESS